MTEADQEERKQMQRGVQSIFTTDQSRRENVLAATGLLAMSGGLTIWGLALRNLDASKGISTSQGVVVSVLTLSTLGTLTVLIGTGLFAYWFAVRRTWIGRHKIEFSVRSNEPVPAVERKFLGAETTIRRSLDPIRGFDSNHRPSKGLIVAVVQSSVLVASYGSLVAEYETDPRAQAWVQTTFPSASLVLNYYLVFLLTGLLGVLVTQFLHGKHFSQ